MSSKEKSTADIRKEDSKKEHNQKKGKKLIDSTKIIVKKIIDEKKEIKYEIIRINIPEAKQKGGSIPKKEEGQNKQVKLTENSKATPRNTTEEGNCSTDIKMINESQFDKEKKNYYSKGKKPRKAEKEKVKKRVPRKKSKCSQSKRKEKKSNKAKREFEILKTQRLDDIILNFEKLYHQKRWKKQIIQRALFKIIMNHL